MKTIMKILTITIAILFTSQSYAQGEGPGTQTISITIENSGNIECSHTAKLVVSYIHNSVGYSQISSGVTMGHHDPTYISVNIPSAATVVSRKVRIERGSDVFVQDVSTGGSYSANPTQWCSSPNEVDGIYFGGFQGSPPVYYYTFY